MGCRLGVPQTESQSYEILAFSYDVSYVAFGFDSKVLSSRRCKKSPDSPSVVRQETWGARAFTAYLASFVWLDTRMTTR